MGRLVATEGRRARRIGRRRWRGGFQSRTVSCSLVKMAMTPLLLLLLLCSGYALRFALRHGVGDGGAGGSAEEGADKGFGGDGCAWRRSCDGSGSGEQRSGGRGKGMRMRTSDGTERGRARDCHRQGRRIADGDADVAAGDVLPPG